MTRATEPIRSRLPDLPPLRVSVVAPGSADLRLFNSLLAHEHYLGHRNTVGDLPAGRQGISVIWCATGTVVRWPAPKAFGVRLGLPVRAARRQAAWQCAARDAFIGWDRVTRERNLQGLTNNTRFLIPAWVQVPHPCLRRVPWRGRQVASHVLGLIARRIRADWQAKYGHPVHALETFVDRSRFKGTCYRAANWLLLGQTRGRTRNDRAHRIQAPVKDVYLYPLAKHFREALGAPAGAQTEGRAGR